MERVEILRVGPVAAVALALTDVLLQISQSGATIPSLREVEELGVRVGVYRKPVVLRVLRPKTQRQLTRSGGPCLRDRQLVQLQPVRAVP